MAASFLEQGVVFLGSAIVCVPIAKRLGIGSVLGYLMAGVLIGPYVLGLVGNEGEDMMHAAEFGVVMMLFLIGLELNPSAFWKMRTMILGMGGLQMLITSAVVAVIVQYSTALGWNAAMAIGLTFGMSSTAIVLQTLKEKGLENTIAGKSAFSVLLLQDIAVIPILALLPVLANLPNQTSSTPTMVEEYKGIAVLAAVAIIYVFGRFMVNPLLNWVAATRIRELFTTASLLIVIAVAYLMEAVGVSAALGTFMAGVMLANSAFRHELESDVEPFKGVLLGLFFTAVGSTINFALIQSDPFLLLSIVLGLMFLKAMILAGIGVLFRLNFDQNLLFSIILCQVGEFAFVLLASARSFRLLDSATNEWLMAVVTVSMSVSPLLLFIHERLISPYLGVKEEEPAGADDIDDAHAPVIIAGFGHFGSTLGRFLRANGVEATILDNDSQRVELLRKMGFKVYYGDATRLDLLTAAGAHKAKIIISAIDRPDLTERLVDQVKKHFPHLKIFVRAKNRVDTYELLDRKVEHIYRESIHASVFMGVDVLKNLGFRAYTSTRKGLDFIRYDEDALRRLATKRFDRENYVTAVREEIELQEKLISEDVVFAQVRHDQSWDSELLKRGGTGS